MAGLLGVFAGLFGRKAADGGGDADPAVGVFQAAAEIAASYGEIAARNVASLNEGGYRAQILEPFESRRMLAALNVASDDGYKHYLLHALNNGQVEPVTLRLLWGIHQHIAQVDEGQLRPDHALDICRYIHVDSLLLAEEFGHAARIARAGLGARAFAVARDPDAFAPDRDKDDRKLAKLIRQHRTAVDRVGEQMTRVYPGSFGVEDRVIAHTAVDTPIWVTVKDHPGARVINDVWFPEEFAKPLVEHLSSTQAHAMAAR